VTSGQFRQSPPPGGLSFGVDVSGIAGDHIMLHAVVQLCLGGLFDIFHGVKWTKPLVAGIVFTLKKRFLLTALSIMLIFLAWLAMADLQA
jgi:hypothetical protein